MDSEKFKAGDKVIFLHPDFEAEILTLKKPWVSGNGVKTWYVEENDVYLYQESYLHKLTKLEKILYE